MLTDSDKLRVRFASGDPVNFEYRRNLLEGIVVRTNPKRAVIRVKEQDYNVPYERLHLLGHAHRLREERVESIRSTAENLLQKYGLKKWRFKFDHSTRRAGCCHYRERLISISLNLACNASIADIRDTILHEIAHALVGRKHHHNAVWKTKAKEIGCSGERCHRLEFSPPRYTVTCENRCWNHTAERRNPHMICRTCGGKLLYSAVT